MDKKKTPVPAGILLLAMMLVASLFLTLLPKLNLDLRILWKSWL